MTTETLTSGTSWQAPADVHEVDVECFGGGAGGGGNTGSVNGGGGGGGGARSTVSADPVTPLSNYAYAIGANGVGAANADGTDGGDTTWRTTVCVAKGGKGGKSNANGRAGGAGGLASEGTGNPKNDGGWGENGRSASAGRGGYGGSSAGTSADGLADGSSPGWTTTTAPTPPAGAGIGGDGGTAAGNPPASGNGGGGGGSGEGTNVAGGNGTGGKIILTYKKTFTMAAAVLALTVTGQDATLTKGAALKKLTATVQTYEIAGQNTPLHKAWHLDAGKQILIDNNPALLNGGFETLGAGSPDVFASWTEAFGSGTISANADSHSGSYSCRMQPGTGSQCIINQAVLTIGKRYAVEFWGKKLSVGTTRVAVYWGEGYGTKQTFTLTDSWAYYSGTDVADWANLAFYTVDASTDFLIDDIRVTLLTDVLIQGKALTKLARTRHINAEATDWAISGQDATLTKGGGGPKVLTTEVTAYTVAMQDGGVEVGRHLNEEATAWSVATQAAGLTVGRHLNEEVTAFDIAAQSAGLRTTRHLDADVGAFTVAAQDASLEVGRHLNAEVADVALAMQDAELSKYAPGKLTVEVTPYTIDTQSAGLEVGRHLNAGTAGLSVSVQNVTFRVTRHLDAAVRSYSIAGQAADLIVEGAPLPPNTMLAETGGVDVVGQDASLAWERIVQPVALKVVAKPRPVVRAKSRVRIYHHGPHPS